MDYSEKKLIESPEYSKKNRAVKVFAILGFSIIFLCIIMRFLDLWIDSSSISYIGTDVDIPWFYNTWVHTVIVYSLLLSPIGLLFSCLGLIGFKKNKYRLVKWFALIGVISGVIFILLNIYSITWLIFIGD